MTAIDGGMDVRPHRKVRSFVKRPGRITAAQQRALETLLPRFGVPFEPRPLDLDALFGREAQRVLDIGFGDGEALLTTAAAHPEVDYLGVEVHEPGVGHLLILLERAGLDNVRVIVRDAVDVIDAMLPDASFDTINLFFPDPWPKKRHHKRRIVQPPFVGDCARILRPGGLLHVATDWAPYAEHTLDVLGASPAFRQVTADAVANDPLTYRPPTKFERRGERLGHTVVDLHFRRLGGASRND